MSSRQFDHLQQSSLLKLQAMVPAGCPLVVARGPLSGFRVFTLDEHDTLVGRYQVVAAFIAGYVACWTRVARPRSLMVDTT